jgi:hypothetical protein
MNQRRIKLGAAPETKPTADPDISKRGWQLGSRLEMTTLLPEKSAPESKPQRLIRPQFMILAVAAALLMLFTIASKSSPDEQGIRDRIPQVMEEYDRYLDARRAALGDATIAQRRNTAEQRLQRIADAAARNARGQIRLESNFLLHLDNDAQSPIYRYSIELLDEFKDD